MNAANLRGITWDHPRGYQGLEAASAEFEKIHGIQIDWHRRSLQSFADAPVDELAAEYDFIILDHPHVGVIADRNCLLPLPLPPDAESASLGGSLESYIWRDQLWAYPIDAACQVAVKRSDLPAFEIPDWETLTDNAHDLSVVTPLLPVDAFDTFVTLVAGLGEDTLPFSAREFCSRNNGLHSLSILKGLYKLGPSEAVTWNPIDVLEMLATTDEFDLSPCLFGYVNYSRPDYRKNQLVYCDLPRFRNSARLSGTLGGAGIGVSSFTAFPDQAKCFAEWVTSEPVQSGIYLENEGQPAHRQTWIRKQNDPQYSGFFNGARRTMENAWTRPRDNWFLAFVDEVCEILPGFFMNDLDETTFLRDMNAIYEKHQTSDL